MLARMEFFGFKTLPDVFAEDTFLQSLLKSQELCVIQDCIVTVPTFSFEGFLKKQARKCVIHYEIFTQYPECGEALKQNFPETVKNGSQVWLVVTTNFPLLPKIGWVMLGGIKWMLSWCFASRIKQLSNRYLHLYHQHGGSYLLRHDASTAFTQR